MSRQGVFNNQGRRSGGYRKLRFPIGSRSDNPIMSDGEPMFYPSLPCGEGRHSDCDGYITFMPKKKVNSCGCKCHDD